MDLRILGRTALVTASTSGLGLSVAKALASEGANVAICGRRGDLARKHASKFESGHGIDADLSDPKSVDEIFDATRSRFGSVDILVWNSGGPPPGPASGLTPEQYSKSAKAMIDPFLRLVQLALPDMQERGWGRIVVIGSSGIQQPIGNLAVSNALRASIASICKTLSSEVAVHGITVNVLIPGRIQTTRVNQLDQARARSEGVEAEEIARRSQALIPVGRYGTVREFGAVAAFLCSDQASYVTGSQIRVDGGLIASTR